MFGRLTRTIFAKITNPITVNSSIAVAAFAGFSLATPNAAGDVISLPASKDNTLTEFNAGVVSNGAGDGIFAGRLGTFGDNLFVRAVIAFDVSAIPAGSTINSAAMTLWFLQAVSAEHPATLHRMQANWGEAGSANNGGAGAEAQPGDCTWLHTFYPGSFWTAPGGDFVAAASDTQIVSNLFGPITWTSAGVASDVQSWVNNPATNFGWMLRGNELVTFSAKKYASRQHREPQFHPVLVIDFTPPIAQPCPADIAPSGGNSAVNVDDLLAVINSWGQCPPPCRPRCTADIAPPPNGNCFVNVDDLLAVINSWGPCPP